MLIKDLTNLGDIVTVINSIEKTLSFSSFKLFRNAITLLDFDLDRGTFGDGFQYHCSGAMGGYSISLNFYEIDKGIKLLHKIYSTPERDIQIKDDGAMHVQGTQTHRENDLPAVIEYSDNGEVCRKVYYKNGKEFRDNDSPVYIATTIEEEDNIEKVYYRYYPAFDYNREIILYIMFLYLMVMWLMLTFVITMN